MDLDASYDSALERLASAGFDGLSEPDRVLATLWGLEADVNNGGFDQYFFNSSGDQAFFAERALRLIGADKMADIVSKAVAFFGPVGVPRDRDARQEMLFQLTDASPDLWDELDRQFYEYPNDISALVEHYLSGGRGAG